ncbi:MAG TPA: S41 family peptidase [Ferruginibacter sp.]|nr:S41 family peptidase [Ferruginibacter sp.]
MIKTSLSTICFILLPCCVFLSCRLNKNTSTAVEDAKKETVVKTQKLSIVQKLKESDHLPVAERIALYHKLKKEGPAVYDFENETELTLYGYASLWANKTTEAIEIFKLIAAEFPNSANAYDNLGEAYGKNGNKELSLANYKRSLELNPDNFNAEDQVERINYPDRIPLKPQEKFAKVYSAAAYRADLDQLGNTLLKVHPNALKFISKKAFWKTIEEKKALVTDNTTYGEFAWHCSEIIASVNCSHTDMGSFYAQNEMLPAALRFPLQTRWTDNRLYVIDPSANAGLKVKDEILSINGTAVAEIMPAIYRHISSQGFTQTSQKHVFNTWSSRMIPYALGFPASYNIVIKGVKDPVALNMPGKVKNLFEDPSVKGCPSKLCFEVLSHPQKTAILSIYSFNYYPWANLSVFKDFIDSSFKKIREGGVEYLIIDLRFNSGGSQQAGIHLLRYLVDKPFTYYSKADFKGKTEKIDGEEPTVPFENGFKGKLYYLIDGNGKSTTGHFMSLVKVLKLGTIIGEELGSNQFCSAGQTICRLKNTKLEYYVADNTHESTATSLPDETGILPDHYVTQSIDDYLNKVDAVKGFAIKLIEKQ